MLQINKKNLVFNINAISEFDDISAISFFELVQNISESVSKNQKIPITGSQVRKLIYAGLSHKDEELTLKQAGEIVENYLKDNDLSDLMEILASAIMEASVFKSKEPKNEFAGKRKSTIPAKASTSDNG
jgi:hypothetical protein